MSYTELKNETHIARKRYNCDAYFAIFDQASISDLTESEQQKVKDFEAKGAKINVGDKYRYIVGINDGDFYVFRANPDMLEIYYNNKIYEE